MYLKGHIVPFYPNRALHSHTASLLVVYRATKWKMGGGAFSYQAPVLWKQLSAVFRIETPSLPLSLGFKLYFSKAYREGLDDPYLSL